ncbi:hypothetical protein bcgnr5379_44140 [Bacillus cereus]|nr:hypothetical protein BC2903_16860 [Bacillus cereus]
MSTRGKHIKQNGSLDAYTLLSNLIGILLFIHKKERIYIRSSPHIYGAKFIIRLNINLNIVNSSIKINKLHAYD